MEVLNYKKSNTKEVLSALNVFVKKVGQKKIDSNKYFEDYVRERR